MRASITGLWLALLCSEGAASPVVVEPPFEARVDTELQHRSPEARAGLVAADLAVDVERAPFVASRLLVRLPGFTSEGGDHARALHELLAALGVQVTARRPLHFGWMVVDVATPSGVRLSSDETAALLGGLRGRGSSAIPGMAAALDDVMRPLLSPLDPHRPTLWPLDVLRAEAAWDLGTSGEDAIGVVDTGLLRAHEDLAAKDHDGFDFISEVTVAADGDGRDEDWADPGTVTVCDDVEQPLLHHGTHISAVIAASTDNGLGVPGIDWSARLVSARTMNVCGGVASDLLDALAWLGGYPVEGAPLREQPVRLVNLSLGARVPCSPALQDYVSTLAEQRGLVFVAAAGNDGTGTAVFAPASCEGVIAVGASTLGGGLAGYTSDVGSIDVLAPGGDMAVGDEGGVLSACGLAEDCYAFAQGTSIATAYVSGAVSLMLRWAPDLTGSEIAEMLADTGEPCLGCDVPVLRLDRAVAAAIDRGGAPFHPPATECTAGACGPSGICGEGLRCASIEGEEPCCLPLCEVSGGGCGPAELCIALDEGDPLGVCVPGGQGREGDGCDAETPCAPGFLCLTGQGQCARQCDQGALCRDADQSCTEAGTSAVCLPTLAKADAESAPESCDPRRGHWDCPESWGCLEQGEGLAPTCIRGSAGELPDFSLCQEALSCASGLCIGGVCSVPCDVEGGCYLGASCDADLAPGGICVPEECEGPDACAEGLACVASPVDEGRLVCGRSGCGCSAASSTPASSGTSAPGFALFLIAVGWRILRRKSASDRDRLAA